MCFYKIWPPSANCHNTRGLCINLHTSYTAPAPHLLCSFSLQQKNAGYSIDNCGNNDVTPQKDWIRRVVESAGTDTTPVPSSSDYEPVLRDIPSDFPNTSHVVQIMNSLLRFQDILAQTWQRLWLHQPDWTWDTHYWSAQATTLPLTKPILHQGAD